MPSNNVRAVEHAEYEEEVRTRWGDTDAYRESSRRTSRYTSADFAAAKKDQEAVRAHREAISKWFYPCSVEMQKNLAVMYIEDPRFKEYYEGRVRGLAQYVHDAIMAQ
jgi:TipAS antibiotic-recognition domain